MPQVLRQGAAEAARSARPHARPGTAPAVRRSCGDPAAFAEQCSLMAALVSTSTTTAAAGGSGRNNEGGGASPRDANDGAEAEAARALDDGATVRRAVLSLATIARLALLSLCGEIMCSETRSSL